MAPLIVRKCYNSRVKVEYKHARVDLGLVGQMGPSWGFLKRANTRRAMYH